MKKLSVLIVFIISSIVIKAQGTGEIKGVVMDKENDETIIGASLWVEYGGNKIGTITDIDGNYTLKPIPSGTYSLYIQFLGKSNYTIAGIKVKSDKITFADTVFMQDSLMKEVVIRPREQLIDPEEPSKLELDNKQIAKIAGARSGGTLLSIASGGAITSSPDGNEIYFRGSRSGTMITFLDGIKIRESVPSVPQAALKSYRVYTGGIPAKYGDTMGGVVEIETKNFFDLYNQRIAERGIDYTNEE